VLWLEQTWEVGALEKPLESLSWLICANEVKPLGLAPKSSSWTTSVRFNFILLFINLVLWYFIQCDFCDFYFIFLCRYLVIKKNDSENVSTPKVGVLNVKFALKHRICRSLKSLICLKWIRKKFSTTLHTQFNYLTLPVTPFKPTSSHWISTLYSSLESNQIAQFLQRNFAQISAQTPLKEICTFSG